MLIVRGQLNSGFRINLDQIQRTKELKKSSKFEPICSLNQGYYEFPQIWYETKKKLTNFWAELCMRITFRFC